MSAAPLDVPQGVSIPVVLTTELTSSAAVPGERFEFRTTAPVTLGSIVVPSRTPGAGRVASVERARRGHNGSLTLQTDELDLADGRRISVDVDRRGLSGHYATRHVFPFVVPVLPFVAPAALSTRIGDLILDPGADFRVVTVRPRFTEPPLVRGATPDPASSTARRSPDASTP